VTRERHPSALRCPLGDREVTQKTSALQRFMEHWFVLAEALPRRSREDRRQKASAPHPAAAAGAVHPPGTKAFLLFPLSSSRQRRRAGGEIAVTVTDEPQRAEAGLTPQRQGMRCSAPAPTCSMLSATESSTTVRLSVGHRCDRNRRLQMPHHWDPQLIIPQPLTAATREERDKGVAGSLILLLTGC